MSVERPQGLPDFTDPPLNEVVLGVQFAQVSGYSQIRAFEVWKLFEGAFPGIEEQMPLPPAFETFGLPTAGTAQLQLGLVTSAEHNRYWFLSKDKDQLIQFQHDRLLHNWRKVKDVQAPYPRFERMIANFEDEMLTLQGYFKSLSNSSLNINQCEITYINHIPISEGYVELPKWLKQVNFAPAAPDDFSFNYRETIRGADNKPVGRLACAGNSAISQGKPLIVLNLTVRGKPPTPDIAGALQFLKDGRQRIVTRFGEITTPEAHKLWGRQQ